MARRSRRPGPDQLAFDLGQGFSPTDTVSNDPAAPTALQQAIGGNLDELLTYRPTPSINPPRPRTQAAGYVADTNSMFVEFRDGAVYEYNDVDQREWNNFKRVKSPGKAINRVFNGKPYHRRYDLES